MPTAARPRPTEMSVGGIAMITKITMNTPNVARTWVRHSGYSRQPNPALGRWSPMVSTSTGCLHGLNQERRHHEPQQPEYFQVQFCDPMQGGEVKSGCNGRPDGPGARAGAGRATGIGRGPATGSP